MACCSLYTAPGDAVTGWKCAFHNVHRICREGNSKAGCQRHRHGNNLFFVFCHNDSFHSLWGPSPQCICPCCEMNLQGRLTAGHTPSCVPSFHGSGRQILPWQIISHSVRRESRRRDLLFWRAVLLTQASTFPLAFPSIRLSGIKRGNSSFTAA